MCTCLCMGILACIFVTRRLLFGICLYCFETSLSLNIKLLFWLDWLVSKIPGSSHLLFSNMVMDLHCHRQHFMWVVKSEITFLFVHGKHFIHCAISPASSFEVLKIKARALTHVRQVLYHWITSSSHILSSYFQINRPAIKFCSVFNIFCILA